MSYTRPISLPLALITCVALAVPISWGQARDPGSAPGTDARAQEAVDKVEVLYGSTLWRKSKYDIGGSYRIERRKRDDEHEVALVLGGDFMTKDGPDLKVVLSPLAIDRVKSKTALKDSLVLGKLQSHRGQSRYRIPESTDLTKYSSVLIHCEQYTILWGGAPLSEGEIVASGSEWTKKTKAIRGRWEIAKIEDGHVIRFGRDFKTKNAPDLKVVLSPMAVSQAKNDNALKGGVVVSLLRSNKGAQEFKIPEEIDLSRYRSLLINCQQYTKLWGGTSLGGS